MLPRSSKWQKAYLIDSGNADLFAVKIKLLLEGLLTSCIEHFTLDLSAIGQPVAEEDFGRVDSVMGLEFQIEDGKPVVILGQAMEELVPGFISLSVLFDNLCVSSITILSPWIL